VAAAAAGGGLSVYARRGQARRAGCQSPAHGGCMEESIARRRYVDAARSLCSVLASDARL